MRIPRGKITSGGTIRVEQPELEHSLHHRSNEIIDRDESFRVKVTPPLVNSS